jgi:alpha-mannosidase
MYYVWGTRILYGPYSYEFALLPFSGEWREADLHRRAMEYSFLPETLQTSPGTGRMGSNIEKIKIAADEDVIMTALYPENGQVVTRFFKSSDSGTPSTVAIKIGGSQLVETRLDGKVIGDVNGKTMLKAWEIKTFRMK